MENTKQYDALVSVTPKTITSSTDATPIVITKTSHGLSTGDLVFIYGHATNVAANGIRKVTVLNSSTFSLQDPHSGANIAGSGAGDGGGTGFFCTAPKIALAEGFSDAEIQIEAVGGSVGMTVGIMVSDGVPASLVAASMGGSDLPNFGATQGAANPWTLADFADDAGGGAITDGDTGLVLAAASHNKLGVNVDRAKWITVVPIAWTAGALTARITLSKS